MGRERSGLVGRSLSTLSGWWRWRLVAVLAGLMLVLGGRMVGLGAGGQPQEGDAAAVTLEKLVVASVAEAKIMPGCEAVSVFKLDSSIPVFRGPRLSGSPGTLASTSDLSIVVAANDHNDLVLMRRPRSSDDDWETEVKMFVDMFGEYSFNHPWLGVAVMGDDDTLLAGVASGSNVEPLHYWVGKYRLSDLPPGPTTGPPLGVFAVDSAPAEIVADPDGVRFHVLTKEAWVYTVDARTMMQAGAPIKLRPIGATPMPPEYQLGHLNVTHATITGDGHYLITNRFDVPEVNLADLVSRRAWVASTGNQRNCGVAVNRGWVNAGLLAIHAVDAVVVYRFEPPGTLVELGRVAIDPPWWAYPSGHMGPAVAWSGSGSHLIAATNHGPHELVVIRVEDEGRRLAIERYVELCLARGRYPDGTVYAVPVQDILTANGLITPPVPTASPSAVPTASRTASPTNTATASATALPSPTPEPVYLPIGLREEPCIGQKQRADVVLVIDASTSMAEQLTSAGRWKLDAAIEAARLFLGLLELPADQAGLVVFNDRAELLQALTGRRWELEAALARIPAHVRKQTRIDLGIELGREQLTGERRKAENQAVLVLLTDGLANPVPASVAVARAAEAKRQQITIFTIGIGPETELDIAELRQMASRPEYFYRVPDAEDLASIYQRIALAIPCPAEMYWGRR